MSTTALPYPVQLEFHNDPHIARWRPLVQWLLVVPQLMIASALSSLRGVLTLISFFTVLFTKKIPRALFDMTAMTSKSERGMRFVNSTVKKLISVSTLRSELSALAIMSCGMASSHCTGGLHHVIRESPVKST